MLNSQKMLVTRGRQGLVCYSAGEPLAHVPAMAGHFVDRIGAGDAVFAVTSLCMRQGAPAVSCSPAMMPSLSQR